MDGNERKDGMSVEIAWETPNGQVVRRVVNIPHVPESISFIRNDYYEIDLIRNPRGFWDSHSVAPIKDTRTTNAEGDKATIARLMSLNKHLARMLSEGKP